MTECTQSNFEFHAMYRREVVAQFDGGDITPNAGGLLLREVDQRLKLTERLAGCFSDYRSLRRRAASRKTRELPANLGGRALADLLRRWAMADVWVERVSEV
jgi:hypothetical protein